MSKTLDRAMRFFAASAALPSGAASGRARSVCAFCGGTRALPAANSNAQVATNMIFIFCRLASNCPFDREEERLPCIMPRSPQLTGYSSHGPVRVCSHGARSCFRYLRLSQKNFTSRAEARGVRICIPNVLRTVPGGTTEPSCSSYVHKKPSYACVFCLLVSYRPLAR